jgi:hypothetical protein
MLSVYHPLGQSYDVLSNDNGFLNYPDNAISAFQQVMMGARSWHTPCSQTTYIVRLLLIDAVFFHAQRTLVSRFAMNETHSIETVRKLNLNVMALLAKLGTTISRNMTGVDDPASGSLGALATLRAPAGGAGWELAAMLYNSDDSSSNTGLTVVDVAFNAVPATVAMSDTMVAAWQLDNFNGSAAAAWDSFNQPVYPSPLQWQAMRDAMEVPMVPGFPRPMAPSLAVQVPLPGVVLLHACAKLARGPGVVSGVRLHVTTSSTPPEVLVSWREAPADRCLQTFVVQYSASRGGTAARINSKDSIFTAYLHAQPVGSPASGCYSVYAVDYWGRKGPASDPVCV